MKIGVVGLGLIGGSIFKDLKKLNYNVIAVSNSQCGEGIYKNYEVLKTCDFDIQILIQSKKEDISKTISQITNVNENNEKMDSMAYGMLYDHWIRLYRYQGTSSS